ncbi:MAG: TetR family transcriptional regulator [Alkalispirochaetaceae bacterium]
MRRTKEEASQTREAIFEAGLQVFSEKGFAAATMSDVAKAAGTTRGAIYWHFSTKEELFREILGRLSAAYQTILEEAHASREPFLETLRATIRKLLRRFRDDTRWKQMQELVIRSAFIRDGMVPANPRDLVEELPVRVFNEAKKRGEIWQDWESETAVMAIGSALTGIFVEVVQQQLELSDRQIDELCDFIIRGIAPRQGDRCEG